MQPNSEIDFWAQVLPTEGCWHWAGANSAYRYGRFGIGGKKVLAHRFSWELHFGPIPTRIEVCHRCDNGFCVRPDHLFLGTHLDNMRDRSAKGRVRPSRGTANYNAKLDDARVLAIRAEYAAGARQIDLAAKYGVDQTVVSKVVLRQAWKHVKESNHE